MDPWAYSAPWGHRLLEKVAGGRGFSLKANRFLVLGLTFLCYTSYHASRKPPSIVKAVLHGSGGNPKPTDALAAGFLGRAEDAGGWAPFNDPKQGNALLGALDLSFLAAYAISMFGAGHIGDRVDLRYFLTGGMIGSGTCVILMGAAYFLNIHTLGYFIAVQIVGGLLQATGWPSVVSVMANWFGKGKRGLIMGLWNAHTSVGNILGSLLAAYMLQYGWGWSFIVPGIVIVVMGLVIFSFLVVEPQDIGFLPQSGSVVGSIVRRVGGNEKVLATVTAIIDGMGSVGAAIGPMVTGYISELPGGFDNVFLMLYGAAACAGLLLMKLLIKESKDLLRARRGTTKDSMPGSTPADLLDYTQISSADDFRYLPPGVSADAHEATIDNETGRVL
ncbi:hypothetical protein APUTEX25_004556 [Auxenochlorella protothecoides]|uniref:Major facilitator superfamily (MFS) profile domain-containing protein n=1 Tax=Auxenochlorella protothecoides TaxID=3075 RepID=A0A3M7L3L3_AUXPR|nr:hypothetical protein APUTEX25_004556 [Auxenochlorella protothecoides]|eukprot:RMZ56132.1 hypothetical protein APUTEX25_004556 [Auxenochlorella protothecoides]